MRVCVFIDGANFYYGLRGIKENYTDTHFDFSSYIHSLLDNDDELVSVHYYNGVLKRIKGKERIYNKQQSFFKRLRNTNKFKVILCRRQKRLNENGEEYHIIKGDDVHLAVDLVKCVYENDCDKIILMSGDGDFEPALHLAKEKNKIINIAYFENNISKNIFKISNQKFLITKKITNKFFYRK